ncbi:MAG: hypothetical protein LIO93_02550 [Bacteroidales bacterium]|nr:hypothetical protein [Bacteroidales bacterium]
MNKKLIFLWVIAVGILSFSCDNTDDLTTPTNTVNPRTERVYMIKNPVQPGLRATSLNDKVWESGDTIRIKFLNGETALQEKVKTYAALWLEHAYIKFEYVGISDLADVKIGFDLDERFVTWSTIGTDCKWIPQDEPSLNFFDFDYLDEETLKGDVLRGFGHVLGLGFEHQSPDSPIEFNSRAQSYLEDYYGLSEEEASNLMELYDTDQTNYTEYDPLSIMVLELPRTITGDRKAVVPNTELSETDKDFIANLYPPKKELSLGILLDGYYGFCSVNFTSEVILDWGFAILDTVSPPFVSIHYQNAKTPLARSMYRFYTIPESITDIYCSMRLINIEITNCPNLKSIMAGAGNTLYDIPLYKLPNLEYLDVSNGPILRNLDVSRNPKLKTLEIAATQVSSLDLSNNPELTTLKISTTPISSLDLSNNQNLSVLWMSQTEILNNPSSLLDIANSLPDRTSLTPGEIILSNETAKTLIQDICTAKNWNIRW